MRGFLVWRRHGGEGHPEPDTGNPTSITSIPITMETIY